MPPTIPLIRLDGPARIGLLADTHCHAPGAGELPPGVLEAFRGVDLVLHLGDMGEAVLLDRLSGVAPVVATRGRDDPPDDPRIAPLARVVEVGDLAIGAVFDLTTVGLAALDGERLDLAGHLTAEAMHAAFGRRVDAVAFGATHRDLVAHYRGVLFVNPGSATLPARPVAGATGTVAILEIRAGVVTAEVVRV
jgi:putative phosphoesterase